MFICDSIYLQVTIIASLLISYNINGVLRKPVVDYSLTLKIIHAYSYLYTTNTHKHKIRHNFIFYFFTSLVCCCFYTP